MGGNDFEVRSAVMELYHQTGLAKIPACVEYIKEMLKQVGLVKESSLGKINALI